MAEEKIDPIILKNKGHTQSFERILYYGREIHRDSKLMEVDYSSIQPIYQFKLSLKNSLFKNRRESSDALSANIEKYFEAMVPEARVSIGRVGVIKDRYDLKISISRQEDLHKLYQGLEVISEELKRYAGINLEELLQAIESRFLDTSSETLSKQQQVADEENEYLESLRADKDEIAHDERVNEERKKEPYLGHLAGLKKALDWERVNPLVIEPKSEKEIEKIWDNGIKSFHSGEYWESIKGQPKNRPYK